MSSKATDAARQLLLGYRNTALLHVAVRLNLFEKLAGNPATSIELAGEVEADAITLRRIMRGLTVIGALREMDGDLFQLTAFGRAMLPGADGGLHELALITGEEYVASWMGLLQTAHTGETAFEHVFGMNVWQHREANPALNSAFNTWLEASTASAGEPILDAFDFTRFRRIADIGGGHGVLLAQLLNRFPHLTGVLFDQQHVLEFASRRFSTEGLDDRVELIAGDFFRSIPVKADAFLLKSILHDWDDADALAILRRCRSELDEDQRLLLIERLLPERASDDPAATMMDLHMLAVTGGRERNASQYRALLADAGFNLVCRKEVGNGFSILEAAPAEGLRSARRASAMQRAMVHATLRGAPLPPYQIQLAIEFPKEVDAGLLREAWRLMTSRHSVFSSRFRFADGQLYMVPVAEPHFPYLELENVDDSEIARFLEEDHVKPFDIESEPLWRVLSLRRQDGRLVWIRSIHHAIFDVNSSGVFIPQWLEYYHRLAKGEVIGLPDAAPGFEKQLEWLEAQNLNAHEAFWRAVFDGWNEAPPLASIPDGEKRIAEPEKHGRISVVIPQELDAQLRDICDHLDLSMNHLLIAAWGLWLGRSAAESTVLFGVMRNGRGSSIQETSEIVGPFLNTLPLRLDIPEETSIGDWLQKVRDQWRAMRSVEHCPLDRIQRWSGFGAAAPLFHSAVNFQHDALSVCYEKWGITALGRVLARRQETDLPLTVNGWSNPQFEVEIHFDGTRIPREYVERAAHALPTILQSIAVDTSRTLHGISLNSPNEQDQILAFGVGAETTLPNGIAAHHLFEEKAAKFADRPALVSGERIWTYGEVEATSSTIAANLLAMGVTPGGIVGAIMPASPEIAVLMLGIMRAGAAFFLLDPKLPGERLSRILDDVRMMCLVVGDSFDSQERGVRTVTFSSLLDPEAGSAAVLPVQTGSSDLAYLVQTSGSTGDPKYIQIEHGSLVNFLTSIRTIYGLEPDDRRLQRATPGSDFFISEILANLSSGSAVVFPAESGPVDALQFLSQLETHRITVTGLPGSWWHEWVRWLADSPARKLPPTLRLVITGMERVEIEAFRQWRRVVGSEVRLINVYGPSEATCVATFFEDGDSDPGRLQSVPIGRPIPNTRLYVVDQAARLLPLGMAGEICIAGAGVMRGYLGNELEDRRVIIPNPNTNDSRYARLYRTGDSGFFMADGNLAFLGRKDQQVKIRGHRIELGVVETSISEAVGGANVVALAISNGSTATIAAFIEIDDRKSVQEIRAKIAERLHPAMIPSRILLRPRLPRLPNGKIDRRGLTAQLTHDDEAASASERLDDLSRRVVCVWERVLNVHPIATDDDFFSLGGDSLLSMRLVAEMEREFGRPLPLRVLLRTPTPAAMIEALQTTPAVPREVSPPDGWSHSLWRRYLARIAGWEGFRRESGSVVLSCLRSQNAEIRLFWAVPAARQEAAGLAESLPPDICLYTFCLAVDELHREEELRGLARRVADEIQDIQPSGDLLLGGYCAGGLLAFEIARLLDSEGRKVRGLILAESVGPDERFLRWQRRRQRWGYHRLQQQQAKGILPKIAALFSALSREYDAMKTRISRGDPLHGFYRQLGSFHCSAKLNVPVWIIRGGRRRLPGWLDPTFGWSKLFAGDFHVVCMQKAGHLLLRPATAPRFGRLVTGIIRRIMAEDRKR